MIFKTPFILFSIPLVIAVLWFWGRRSSSAAIRFSCLDIFPAHHSSWRLRLRHVPLILRFSALACFIIALSGPRLVSQYTDVASDGIDIVLAIDISGSMAAEDFLIQGRRRNRLDVVKDVVKDFIQARPNDRIGIVAFSGAAYAVSPLTSDQNWLMMNLDRLRLGMVEDGTAVGSGLASSLLRLQESPAESKVIILLTDGVNNAGRIAPLEAAAMAEALDVKVYTIGVGSTGLVPFPVQDAWGRTRYQNVRIEFDQQVLNAIAQKTGGRYFSADNTEALKDIYRDIDQLETSEVHHRGYLEYEELFWYFVIVGLGLLFLELALKESVLMALP